MWASVLVGNGSPSGWTHDLAGNSHPLWEDDLEKVPPQEEAALQICHMNPMSVRRQSYPYTERMSQVQRPQFGNESRGWLPAPNPVLATLIHQ